MEAAVDGTKAEHLKWATLADDMGVVPPGQSKKLVGMSLFTTAGGRHMFCTVLPGLP